jgi:hypothetical protein
MKNQMRDRVKESFPSVLLTLLSIMQAVALELLWGKVVGLEVLYEASMECFVIWVQVVSTFVGLILVWVIYAGNVMRFRWTPNISDSIYPFLAGVLEFWFVAAIGQATIGVWILTLGGLFAAMTVISQLTMQRARADDDNADFFRSIPPAKLKDFLPQIILVGIFLMTGTTLLITEVSHHTNAAIVVLTLLFLAWQFRSFVAYWNASIEPVIK